jgi:hypothetical protein
VGVIEIYSWVTLLLTKGLFRGPHHLNQIAAMELLLERRGDEHQHQPDEKSSDGLTPIPSAHPSGSWKADGGL